MIAILRTGRWRTVWQVCGLLAATLVTLHCSASPEERVSSIYRLKAQPNEENRLAIREMLDHPSRDVRATALNALVGLGEDDADRLAVDGLEDDDAFVRATAAKLLGDLGNVEHADVLKRHLLDDSNAWVRQRAAESLTEFGGPSAIDGLVAALDDPMKNVRLAAVVGVRKLAPGDATAQLARLVLDDSVWEIRVQAATALGASGSPEMRPVLDAALSDENEFVRNAVSNALRVLDDAGEPPEPDDPLADQPGA